LNEKTFDAISIEQGNVHLKKADVECKIRFGKKTDDFEKTM